MEDIRKKHKLPKILFIITILSLLFSFFFIFSNYGLVSMTGDNEYKENTLLIIHKTKNTLKQGKVITYQDSFLSYCTEKVVFVFDNGKKCYTIDKNNGIIGSKEIKKEQILGSPIIGIPYMGWIATSYLIISIAFLTILCFVEIYQRREEKELKKKKKIELNKVKLRIKQTTKIDRREEKE